MSVVGVDFGCKNAVIAAAGRGGVDVVLNGNSNRLNANMISYSDSRHMGEAAEIKATSNYRNTVTNIKRLIGLSFDDPRAQAEMSLVPFTCVPIEHATSKSIGIKVNYNSEETVVPVEHVAGSMLKHLGSIAAAKSAETSNNVEGNQLTLSDPAHPLFPKDWVVTIPGYYTDAQRRAFLNGCKIAGLDGVRRLMHEHTATALAYGIFKDIRKEFTKDKPSNIMFLDMGATSYSCCIVTFEPGKLTVKTAQFDEDLGGRDFDRKIAEWIAMKFEEKYKGKLSGKPMERPKVALKLLAAAEKAKKTLSPAGVKEVRINLECLMDDFDFSTVLKADEYEAMCAPLINRLVAPIERALAETSLSTKDISSFEIVGGGTRVGCVKRELSKILGLREKDTNNGLSTTLNADEAIARGAALQSAILSPRFKVLPYDIIEYQPFPVKISWDGETANSSQEGVEVEGDVEGSDLPTNSVVMFDRGSNFNCVRRVTLRRSGDFVVTASYDDSSSKHNYPEGVTKDIVVFNIKAPKGDDNKIRVNVKQDIHGCILLSSAQMVEEVIEEEDAKMETEDGAKEGEAKEGEEAKKEEEAKPEKKKKIKKTNLEFSESRPMDWTKAELEKAFETEVSMSNNDRIVRETGEMRNELEAYIYDMRDKIISESGLAPYANEEEKNTFSASLESTENWLYEDGFDATKSVYAEKLTALKAMGNPMEVRKSEATTRPEAISALQRTVEKYSNWINASQGQDDFAHITDEDFLKCREKCDETANWMYEALDKQGSLTPSQNPAVLTSEIMNKSRELTNLVNPIMHKPKPAPKVEEKKEAEKEEKTEEKPAEEDATPMETDEEKPSEESEPMDTSK